MGRLDRKGAIGAGQGIGGGRSVTSDAIHADGGGHRSGLPWNPKLPEESRGL